MFCWLRALQDAKIARDGYHAYHGYQLTRLPSSPPRIRIAVETTGIRKTHTIHTTHTDRVTQGKNTAGYWVASIPAHTGPRGASRARMASYCHLTAEACSWGKWRAAWASRGATYAEHGHPPTHATRPAALVKTTRTRKMPAIYTIPTTGDVGTEKPLAYKGEGHLSSRRQQEQRWLPWLPPIPSGYEINAIKRV